MPDCIFCDIVAGRAPASIVYHDDRSTAFLDHHPVTPGHLMVVPNRHAELLGELGPDLATHLLRVAMRMAAALRSSGLPCEGINLFLADGEAAFQEVPHAHLHVIPRTPGDGFALESTAWARPQPSREILEAHADAIRETLARLA